MLDPTRGNVNVVEEQRDQCDVEIRVSCKGSHVDRGELVVKRSVQGIKSTWRFNLTPGGVGDAILRFVVERLLKRSSIHGVAWARAVVTVAVGTAGPVWREEGSWKRVGCCC